LNIAHLTEKVSDLCSKVRQTIYIQTSLCVTVYTYVVLFARYSTFEVICGHRYPQIHHHPTDIDDRIKDIILQLYASIICIIISISNNLFIIFYFVLIINYSNCVDVGFVLFFYEYSTQRLSAKVSLVSSL